MKLNFARVAVASALFGAALSGCIVAPAPGYYADVAVTEVAPPAPQYEVVGGAWFWEGGRHVWHPGRWEAPRPGYRWVPHTWRREGDRWHMQAGRWEHEGREERHGEREHR